MSGIRWITPVKSFYTGQSLSEGLAAGDGKQYSFFVRD